MNDPHAKQPVLKAGPPPEKADGTILLMHGRGASAESILSLYDDLGAERIRCNGTAGGWWTWYPHSFLAPIDANQPYLDSALGRIDSLVAGLLAAEFRVSGLYCWGSHKGACLTSEFVARHPRRYGAVIVLTGGLVGPPGTQGIIRALSRGHRCFSGRAIPDPHVRSSA